MMEKKKKSFDTGKILAALMTDLSNTFDCPPRDLTIAKLNAYWFSFSSRLIQSYLHNRKQRTTINSAYSSWEETLVHRVLGP